MSLNIVGNSAYLVIKRAGPGNLDVFAPSINMYSGVFRRALSTVD